MDKQPMAGTRQILISQDVFDLFPEYRRGVVVFNDIENHETPEAVLKMLREAEKNVRGKYQDIDLTQVSRLQSWREAFRITGVKPTKYRPSIEGLIRRVLQGSEIPSINCLVDIGNLFSLLHVVPVGSHAIDVVNNSMVLRKAEGDELFYPYGADHIENPEKDELIFVDGNLVMTRRWTWRQAKHTLTEKNTKAVEFNVDGLSPVSHDEVEAICIEIASIVEQFCGGKSRSSVLSKENPAMDLGYFA